jgi:isopentenyl diphosphate isomerase/L-lactate dehydrogenase-like FMN-dependent dehydrogenase
MAGSGDAAGGCHDGAPRFAVLGEIAEAARENVAPPVWNFLEGGAGDELTLAENRRAFERWHFRPRVLSGIGPPETSTTFLGIPLTMPVLTAPFGADRLFHPDGHLAIARANARFGTAAFVPSASSYALEDVVAAAPAAARIFQVHAFGSEAPFVRLLERAKAAGFELICLTVDCPPRGWRERIMRDRFRPEWESELLRGNYPADPPELLGHLEQIGRPLWTWAQVTELCSGVGLPWIAKGILTADDARAAVEAGAKGVVVSNHGGRQLDSAPAALDQLPEVVAEVGGEVAIALDSGVRRGTDILKALALGAEAVLIGRLAAMGLAADGEAGVYRVLELLHAELVTTMALVGRGTIASIDPSLLQPAPR